MKTYYIGADVHKHSSNLAIMNKNQIIRREEFRTEIPNFLKLFEELNGNVYMIIEESTLAGWLYCNLHDKVKNFVVCDPRKNRAIYDDGDKDDQIDAGKLVEILKNKSYREVYHNDDADRIELKAWVKLYDTHVKEVVSCKNKIYSLGGKYGVIIPASVVKNVKLRNKWHLNISDTRLLSQLNFLFTSLDDKVKQVKLAKRQLEALCGKYDVIDKWCQLPGIGLIRAATIFTYIDTPFRFSNRSKLHKYCGVGLVRSTSGTDQNGRPKATRLKLPKYYNRHLKNAFVGGALSAISANNNMFKDYYESLILKGKYANTARRCVARKLINTMMGMWKSKQPYIEGLA